MRNVDPWHQVPEVDDDPALRILDLGAVGVRLHRAEVGEQRDAEEKRAGRREGHPAGPAASPDGTVVADRWVGAQRHMTPQPSRGRLSSDPAHLAIALSSPAARAASHHATAGR